MLLEEYVATQRLNAETCIMNQSEEVKDRLRKYAKNPNSDAFIIYVQSILKKNNISCDDLNWEGLKKATPNLLT